MGIKDGIDYIKQELSSDEKMLEGLIKVESFIKKYKKYILTALFITLFFIVTMIIKSQLESNRIESANEVFNTLKETPNKELEEKLKSKDKELYAIYKFNQAIEQNSTKDIASIALPEIFKDLKEYQEAMLNRDLNSISVYLSKNDVPLKDLALLVEAYLLIKEQKINEAKKSLLNIPINSPLKDMANTLLHYLITQEAR